MRRMGVSFVVSVLTMCVLSACSSLKPHDAAEPTISSSEDVTPSATAEPDPIMPVKNPWNQGDFQKGMQIFWQTTGEYVQTDATRTLDYVVGLGANSVGITFPIYIDGVSPTKVYAGKLTPSVNELRLVVKEARARKLRVMLRPIIAEGNIVDENPMAWRGSITPDDQADWFQSYQTFIDPYLVLAQEMDVEEFVLGTEMTSLQGAREWRSVQRASRKLFSGQLSYCANWEWTESPSFSHVGVDLYPPLDVRDDASVEQLTSGLSDWLIEQRGLLGDNIVIHEVSIPARSGAYSRPWGWGDVSYDGPLDLEMQSRWFKASYKAAQQTEVGGIYYWVVDSMQQFGKDLDVDSQPAGSFIGRPAEKTIHRNFS